VLLIGLVAMNVSLLKLNAQAGRNAEKAKVLRIRNTQLRAQVSRLASSERLQRAGQRLGFVMPTAGKVRYLSPRPVDAHRAAKALRAWGTLPPNAVALAGMLTVERQAPPTPTPEAAAGTTSPAGPTGPAAGSAGDPNASAPQGAGQAPGATAQPPGAAGQTPAGTGQAPATTPSGGAVQVNGQAPGG
jgi:hypothetical protein